MNEYLLDVDKRQQPKVFTKYEGDRINVFRLIMLEPGTLPTHPTLGVGLVSRWRFRDVDTIKSSLASTIEAQLKDFMPQLIDPQVNVTIVNNNNKNIINISVRVNGELTYTFKVDEETRHTLASL
jgi:PHD/YefM family antitoxin component YafN of YafNO toxin-antitoxin module